ncbi:MAG: hypothetical protein EOP11_20605 [Proteobacteria bacterium]|nr:MAG: hypothetical protein EOP11_20605 [Pseudomonadota bacterium]
MKLLLLLSLAGAALSAWAGEPIRLAPSSQDSITTKETVVSVRGQKFRRLEINGKSFFLRFQQPDDAPKEKRFGQELIECEVGAEMFHADEVRVLAEVKVTKVSTLYFKALERDCANYEITPRDIQLGFKVKTSERSDVDLGFRARDKAGLEVKPTFNLSF